MNEADGTTADSAIEKSATQKRADDARTTQHSRSASPRTAKRKRRTSASASARPKPQRRLRLAIYSHDTFGLGHLRRNLLLSNAIEKWGPPTEIVLITGSPRAYFFDTPPHLEIVKLPSVTKDSNGAYVPRNFEIPLGDVLAMRKGMIRDAVIEHQPDALLVDHAPIGMCGELLPLLSDLRHGTNGAPKDCQLILGLRDILDDPQHVRNDWQRNGIYSVLESLYHRLWVYGDRSVFDLGELYGMSESVADRLSYLGYLGRITNGTEGAQASASRDFADRSRPHVLCLVGGGGDGFPLAQSFVEMLERFPEQWNGTLITGPFLPRPQRDELNRRVAELSNARVLRFTARIEPLLHGSDVVITMGGYNSMLEAHSLRKRVVVVPRVFPRREQWLRASSFEEHGLLRMVEPDKLSPAALAEATEKLLSCAAPPAPGDLGIAWDGMRVFARKMHEIARERIELGDSKHAGNKRLRA